MTILQHEFVANCQPSNVVGAISLDSGLDFISLALVRCTIVCCNSVVAEVDGHVNFCLLDCLQLRGGYKYDYRTK